MILKQIADVKFPSRWAIFRLLAFEAFHANGKAANQRQETALALVLGDLQSYPPLVRIHSQCTTGEAFHSLRCDCHDQLQMALGAIAEEGAGVLVYEQQEGRGIGLMEKLRAYELQDQGLDTVEANLHLGHAVDLRDYAVAVQILHFLRIRSLRLISNNPDKVKAVTDSGILLVERVTADVPPNRHSRHYIATKREKLGHFSNPEVGSSFVASDGAFPGPLLADKYRETSFPRGEAGTETRGGPWPMS
jgi:GTP cyclohydrolase II